jgi:hypothetical protein
MTEMTLKPASIMEAIMVVMPQLRVHGVSTSIGRSHRLVSSSAGGLTATGAASNLDAIFEPMTLSAKDVEILRARRATGVLPLQNARKLPSF